MTQPFITHERVRWSDVDHSRIIRYDAYTRFFERGEMELLRAAGLPLGEFVKRTDITLPRRVLHQEYHSPALLDELLEVRTSVSRIGTTSFTLSYRIHAPTGELRATGHMVLVAVNPETFAKCELPRDVVEKLQPFMSSPSVGPDRDDG